ncbi:MAG: SsrA-binding protein SmpB [Ignavibacteria bacterium]|nr:SsrA-binding protein SmpB [Ignavibacteria bacterium]
MKEKPEGRKIKIIQRNRRAFHEFEILQKFEAGIVLEGSEVKALRQGKCSLQDAYCVIRHHRVDKEDKPEIQAKIVNLYIGRYEQSCNPNYDPRRPRTLLLHSREIMKLYNAFEQKGLAIIPISIYFSGPYVKLEIALAKYKKKYDKREEIKKRDIEKEVSKKVKF